MFKAIIWCFGIFFCGVIFGQAQQHSSMANSGLGKREMILQNESKIQILQKSIDESRKQHILLKQDLEKLNQAQLEKKIQSIEIQLQKVLQLVEQNSVYIRKIQEKVKDEE